MASESSETREPSRAWVEAWRADVAEPLRVRRAYRRFLASRSAVEVAAPRSTPLQAARWVALGVVLGTSSLLAATRVADWVTRPAGVASAPAPSPVALPTVRNLPQAKPPSPSPIASQAPSPPPLMLSIRSRAVGEASEPELWQRAARGLRDRDFAAADAALEQLMRRGSPTEQESARLVRAQVLLARGRSQDAELLLQDLAAQARSAKVRLKALELLSGQRNSPSNRSFSPGEGANEP